MSQYRQPPGIPTGGQFAAGSQGRSTVSLDPQPAPVASLDAARATNLFGPLDGDTRGRLEALVADPTPDSWDDAYSLVINGESMTTMWQAVLAVDPDFTASKPADGPWPSSPSQQTVLAALRYARPGHPSPRQEQQAARTMIADVAAESGWAKAGWGSHVYERGEEQISVDTADGTVSLWDENIPDGWQPGQDRPLVEVSYDAGDETDKQRAVREAFASTIPEPTHGNALEIRKRVEALAQPGTDLLHEDAPWSWTSFEQAVGADRARELYAASGGALGDAMGAQVAAEREARHDRPRP